MKKSDGLESLQRAIGESVHQKSRPGRVRMMPRRPAIMTQADVARFIRAAKQAGAASVEVRTGEFSILIHIEPFKNAEGLLESKGEIVL